MHRDALVGPPLWFFIVALAVVPVVVDQEGGFTERCGDAILAVINALGDQPDHAARAFARPSHARSIITIGGRTLDEVTAEPDVIIDVRPLGPTDLKGKTEPTEAFERLAVTAPSDGSQELRRR